MCPWAFCQLLCWCQWNKSVFLIFSKVWISPCEVWPILVAVILCVENSDHGPSSQFSSVDSTWKYNCSATIFFFTSWFSSVDRPDGWKQQLGPQELEHPSYRWWSFILLEESFVSIIFLLTRWSLSSNILSGSFSYSWLVAQKTEHKILKKSQSYHVPPVSKTWRCY